MLAHHGEQLLARLARHAARLNVGPHRGVGQCVDQHHPSIAQGVGCHGGADRHGEGRRQILRDDRGCIGRASGEAQRPHDPAGLNRLGEIDQPLLGLLPGAALESFAKLTCKLTGCLVTHHVGTGDHRAQVSKRQLVDVGHGSLGPVEPVSQLKAREQSLGNGQDRIDGNRREPFGKGLGVLLLDGAAHRGKSSDERLFRNGLLFGREARDDRLTMDPARSQLLGLRAHGQGSGALGSGSLPTRAGGTLLGARAVGTRGARAPISSVAARATISSIPSIAARAPITSVASVALAPGNELACHEWSVVPFGSDDLDGLGQRSGALGGEDGEDGDAVDVEVGIGANDITDLRTHVQQRSVQLAFRESGARSTPRPGAVAPIAGKFDLNPS